ncbi:DotU family type VI secretion system protein [Paraburkholderia guartelaensis]|uniref:DotU family type VI secretion system protein n=1 Tax=Paraburkholderia guartelaensis TaxID=2546446 RepID=UPI002AB76D8A|nr:DotU family type VI secretion system protein [Paraburkholderia guartelaensis]
MNPLNDPFAAQREAGHGAFMAAPPDLAQATGDEPWRTDAPAGEAREFTGAALAASAASAAAAEGGNPLVAAANALLNLIPQIRYTVHHPNPAWLREHLANEIRQFEERARGAGASPEQIGAARYCLCTALDEAAALTPWGGAGDWSANSLLVAFHNETWGGEKFFELLNRLMQQPREQLNLLELLYYCLVLGFEGRYRVLDNGRAQLDDLRHSLARTIRSVRGDYDAALSAHWRDEIAREDPHRFAVPLWACAALALLVGFGVYLGFDLALAGRSDKAFATIGQLQIPSVRLQAAEPAAVHPAPPPRLAGFLAPEIAEGLVEVRDAADRSVIVLRGDGLFESGSATVIDRYQPTLARVAAALARVPGAIVVAGYTDNVPVHSARFPSNWNLSVERAQAVAAILAARLGDAARVRAEGRGAADPVAPNDSAANRARNRRVEITLLTAPPKLATPDTGVAGDAP